MSVHLLNVAVSYALSALAFIVGSVAVHWSVTGSTAVQPTMSSGSPKLWDMMLPLRLCWLTTAVSAAVMLGSRQSLATTRYIVAPGASE